MEFGTRLVCYPQELQGGSGGGALGLSEGLSQGKVMW